MAFLASFLPGYGTVTVTDLTATGDVTVGDDVIATDDVIAGDVSSAVTRMTAPIFGTTTAADVVFQRNSVEMIRLVAAGGPELRSTSPLLAFNETDATADNKKWWFLVSAAEWRVDAIDDAESTAGRGITLGRSGTVPTFFRVGSASVPVPLDVTGGIALATPPATKTGTYTATLLDFFIPADTTGGAFSINLPAASTARGKIYAIRKTAASANALTLDPSGAELIDGGATTTVTSVTTSFIICNGTSWQTFGVMT